MAIIVPAILEHTIDELQDKIRQIIKLPDVERIQVDFGDGKFVPNSTLPVTEIDPLNPAFTWEAHLMVEEPVDFLDYQIVGFSIVIVHYEAFKDKSIISASLQEIKKLGLKVGMAINPETPVSVLEQFAGEVDSFLVMSIHPGFQGREFLPETVVRVRELRAKVPHGIIEVDGGVNTRHVKDLVAAGSDLLVVGSALFETENIQENYDNLLKETI